MRYDVKVVITIEFLRNCPSFKRRYLKTAAMKNLITISKDFV